MFFIFSNCEGTCCFSIPRSFPFTLKKHEKKKKHNYWSFYMCVAKPYSSQILNHFHILQHILLVINSFCLLSLKSSFTFSSYTSLQPTTMLKSPHPKRTFLGYNHLYTAMLVSPYHQSFWSSNWHYCFLFFSFKLCFDQLRSGFPSTMTLLKTRAQ